MLKEFKRVIKECKYSNTYKMAWAKAIIELSSQHFTSKDEYVDLSLFDLATKMFKYYWDQTIFLIYFNPLLINHQLYYQKSKESLPYMDYYSKHAKEYILSTKTADMNDLYKLFESHIEAYSKILDIGFGSGRDSLYFQNNGYQVTSIDPVKEFCDNAKDIGLNNVIQIAIENIDYHKEFNGIWACASLLHIESSKLVDVFNKCYEALIEKGVLYVSFKEGNFEGYLDGRYFTYLTKESFINIINHTKFKINSIWINEDKLNREVKWLNAILIK